MEFCKALEKALTAAPNDEAREAVQAVIDAYCGEVTTTEDGPPKPGGGNGNGPPGGG